MEIDENEKKNNDNKRNSSDGASENEEIFTIKEAPLMLNLGIIQSPLTRNFLPKYQLEILKSVLKYYSTRKRLRNIFDFKNHQEHPVPKEILDY